MGILFRARGGEVCSEYWCSRGFDVAFTPMLHSVEHGGLWKTICTLYHRKPRTSESMFLIPWTSNGKFPSEKVIEISCSDLRWWVYAYAGFRKGLCLLFEERDGST